MKKRVYCFKVSILLMAGIFFYSAVPKVCFAAREDVALSQDYQLGAEKESLKDNLSWEIDYAYGLSNISRLLGLGSRRFAEKPSKEYLDTLDLTYSYNDFLLMLAANYLVTSKLELSVGIPVSVVFAEITNGRKRRGLHAKLKPSIGDIYGGISYALLTESKYKPLGVVTLDINSALSKHSSMGDGFWGFTPGLYLRKFISESAYMMGLVGNTYRFKRRGLEPGNIMRYGSGVGFLSEGKKVEFILEKTYTAKTTIGAKTVLNSEEDLSMSAVFTTILGRHTTTIGLTLSGLEKGFDWGQNTAGIFVGFTF